MSNKLKLQDHATDLQSILDTINALPEAGADAYAVIAVTYPEGGVCTCSNSSETLELDNTVGYGFFLIPNDGEWIVTVTDATDSAKTKSQSVSITNEGQFETITLSYELVILTETDGLASGYSVSGKAVRPAIDITNYTTMTVVAKVTWRAASGYGVWVGVSTSVSSTADFPAEVQVTSTSKKTYNIDISELEGLHYIRAYDTMEFSEGTIGIENSSSASIEIYSIKFI